jgi:hypothetical protein
MEGRAQAEETGPGQRQGLQDGRQAVGKPADVEVDPGVPNEPTQVAAAQRGAENMRVRLHDEERT